MGIENSRRGLFWRKGGRKCTWMRKSRAKNNPAESECVQSLGGRKDPTFWRKYKKLVGGKDGEGAREAVGRNRSNLKCLRKELAFDF